MNSCSTAATVPGVTLRKIIIAIALAVGGIAALEWLVEEEENPTRDPHPAPEEEENPPLPWLPGQYDEDNGCEQRFVTIAPIDRKHVVDDHTWHAGKGKSEFYSSINWEWLATVYALRERAIPSGVHCVRRVTYLLAEGLPRNVGIDRDISFKPTPVYSVVTRADGSLVSAYPGNAKIWPVP